MADSEPNIEENKEHERGKKQQQLNSMLLDAIAKKDDEEVKRLLKEGASPNSTCREAYKSACHLAAFKNCQALEALLLAGADRYVKDKIGLTAMHYAAVAGGPKQIAMLLDFPEDLQSKTAMTITPETLEEIKASKPLMSPANIKLLGIPATPEEQDLPEAHKDSDEHDCNSFVGEFADVQVDPCLNWTPLHIASAACNHSCLQVLLAAGADPNVKDKDGYRALDLAGARSKSSDSIEDSERENFLATIKCLREFGGDLETDENKREFNSVLHTAVLIRCPEAFPLLLDAGAPLTIRNSERFSPLDICERDKLADYEKILAPNKEDLRRKQRKSDIHERRVQRFRLYLKYGSGFLVNGTYYRRKDD